MESPSSQSSAPAKPKSSGLFRNRPSWATSKPSPSNTNPGEERDMFSKSDLTFARMKEESARRVEAEQAERDRKEQEEARMRERQAKRRKLSEEAKVDGESAAKESRELSKSPKRKSPRPLEDAASTRQPTSSRSERKLQEPPWEEIGAGRRSISTPKQKQRLSMLVDLDSGTGSWSRRNASQPSSWSAESSGKIIIDDDEDGFRLDDEPRATFGMRKDVSEERGTNGKQHEACDMVSSTHTSPSKAASNEVPSPQRIDSPIIQASPTKPAPKPDKPNPILEIFVWSRLPDTQPLICKRRIRQNLRDVRKAWLYRNSSALSSDVQDQIFLINNQRMHLFDVTTPASLGIEVNETTGEVYIKGKEGESLGGGAHGKDEDAKIWMEAVTTESLRELELQEKAEKEEKLRKARALSEEARRPGNSGDANGGVSRIPLIMKAKEYDEYRVKVKSTTKISQMIATFCRVREVPEDKQVFLMLDGEQLEGSARVEDTDIAKMDHIDVHIK
ncbi:MAG: hypothetical protein M1828_001473 [Chrysothrix sp. TS-e1954]|nr:MAG: hypothetical protein M1828_001473 [Chrysothrix sp. TS-e1954]